MSQLPRYESYKDSGVQWLGEIPSHWEVWKITHAMDLIGSGTTPKSDNLEYYDGDVLWVTTSELRESYIYDTKQKVTDSAIQDYSALKKYPINSIAIAMYGATIGRLGILAKEATFNQACCVFSGSKVLNHKFLYYWLWMRRPILISLSNGGGQPNLSQDDLKKLKLALPPMDEQKIIADFLDKRLAQVDALIAKQETLLEKLAEQRVALISHAVTKGLNPDVEMKESGVEWLGEVPSHWIDTKFKYYVYFQEGPGILAVDFRAEGVPLIRISGLKDNTVTLNGCNFLDEEKVKETWNHFKLTKKDMIISASASLSEACDVTDEAIGAIPYTGLIKVRPQQESLLKSYLKIFLSSRFFYEQVSILQTGATIQHYGPAHLRQISILVPPIEEQARIVEHVEKTVNEINALTSKVVRTIETLREYRSTLITQVVTGKIDVRNLKLN